MLEILETRQASPDAALLRGCHLDFPLGATARDGFAVEIIGWALGRTAPFAEVRVECDGALLASSDTTLPRPDVAEAYPGADGTESCGFRLTVSLLGLPLSFELQLLVEFPDCQRAVVGCIRGRRTPVLPPSPAAIQPLLITTLGRTGSTWLTRLLGMHSRLVSYRPFEFETRASAYWTRILCTAAHPASYLQILAADLSDDLWWLGQKPLPFEQAEADPEVLRVLGDESIRRLAACCREQIDAFYRQVARLQGKPHARFFAEKQSPDLTSAVLRELYPEAREIILVRDFRDMLCSIFAYSAKQGFTGFGAAGATDPGRYVWTMRANALDLLQAWRSRSSRVLLVRYEDLILAPRPTLAAIFAHLDLADSQAQRDQLLQAALAEIIGSAEHRTSLSATASIGRWRHELDPATQKLCHEALGDLLGEFGYLAG